MFNDCEGNAGFSGECLNRLDEPVCMAVPKPMLTDFGIHYRLESCEYSY